MATTRRQEDETNSGALLIVLAVILAIGAAVYFGQYAGTRTTEVTIENTAPAAGVTVNPNTNANEPIGNPNNGTGTTGANGTTY